MALPTIFMSFGRFCRHLGFFSGHAASCNQGLRAADMERGEGPGKSRIPVDGSRSSGSVFVSREVGSHATC